jgi:hypothetical protein
VYGTRKENALSSAVCAVVGTGLATKPPSRRSALLQNTIGEVFRALNDVFRALNDALGFSKMPPVPVPPAVLTSCDARARYLTLATAPLTPYWLRQGHNNRQ